MLAFVQSDFTRLYWLSRADSLVQAQVHNTCHPASISRIPPGKVLRTKEQTKPFICKSVTFYLKCESSDVWELII